MLRYCATAAALKAFSLTPARPLYRKLGNRFGGARRARGRIDAGPSHYLIRAQRVLEAAGKHRLVDDGATVLEIGTGWVHWEATVLRLFYDVHATLVDVWDNRQLPAFKAYIQQLDRYIDSHFAVTRARADGAHQLLRKLLQAKTFDELYAVAGFTYIIDPPGALAPLGNESFDFIVSCVVLEHLDRTILSTFINNTARVLKPGGHSLHMIDLGDHLSYSDPKARPKQYLAYGERTWKLFFGNHVQYFNRVQPSEWLALFEQTPLRLVANDQRGKPLQDQRVARQFRRFKPEELEVETMTLLHEKPLAT